MRALRTDGLTGQRQRLWNWTFWAAIGALEIIGVLLSNQT